MPGPIHGDAHRLWRDKGRRGRSPQTVRCVDEREADEGQGDEDSPAEDYGVRGSVLTVWRLTISPRRRERGNGGRAGERYARSSSASYWIPYRVL
jgi:hypothetical protein